MDHILEPLYAIRLTIDLEKTKYMYLTSPRDEGNIKIKPTACTLPNLQYDQSGEALLKLRTSVIYYKQSTNEERVIIETYMVIKLLGTQKTLLHSSILLKTQKLLFMWAIYIHLFLPYQKLKLKALNVYLLFFESNHNNPFICSHK